MIRLRSLGVLIEYTGRNQQWRRHPIICDMIAKFNSLVALKPKVTASLACFLLAFA